MTWPGRTRSPLLTRRSIIRPETRNASGASSCARMEPVSTTGTPASRFAIVTVRTGRISGGVSAVSCRQAAPSAISEAAKPQAAHGSRLESLRDEERTSTATLSLSFRFSSNVRVEWSRACGENTQTERSVKSPAGCGTDRGVECAGRFTGSALHPLVDRTGVVV